jgi:cysteine synthase A
VTSTGLEDVSRPTDRAWVDAAVRRILDLSPRATDTPLLRLPLSYDDVHVHLMDESLHPTGSLKHRLASSLVLYGLVNGWIREGTTLVEASSGSTAVSEAFVAELLGLPFVAVVPRTTSPEKIALIEQHGGTCRFVDDAAAVYDEAARTAKELGGHYLDQFTYAERATDWRGNNNIAESVFAQLESSPYRVPRWVVVAAGTGGTSATFGRYLRHQQIDTRLCVVDPEGSAFFPSWVTEDPGVTARGSRIEGIGRPRVEASFLPGVVDRMIRVPDAASVAATRWLHRRTGWRAGPSTGTNLVGALHLAAELRAAGENGSIVTLLCDQGERYASTTYDDGWVRGQGLDLAPWDAWLHERA